MPYLQEVSPGVIVKQPQEVGSSGGGAGGDTLKSTNSVTLLDNVGSLTTIISYSIASVRSLTFRYSIARGSTFRKGFVQITHDGVTPTFDDDFTQTAATGIVLSGAISGGNLVIQYTSSATGQTAFFQFNDLEQWS